MPALEVDRLKKTFSGQNNDDLEVLKGISFAMEAGENLAVVGPSGSGKSTLLHIIGTLDQPTSGSVSIDGQDPFSLNEKELARFRNQNIGFVFQSYNLIPVLTARENVEFVMLLQGESDKKRKDRVEELLTAVGLSDKMDRRPAELSGGQQQRVAVARALASKPSFILADEPTANLDSSSTADLLDIMASLNEKENMTFIFSTHDQRVIDRARRVVSLEDGKIIQDATK